MCATAIVSAQFCAGGTVAAWLLALHNNHCICETSVRQVCCLSMCLLHVAAHDGCWSLCALLP